MKVIRDIQESLGRSWLPFIYSDSIRPQRTRSITIDVPDRENDAVIQYTLLGIELKVGRRRHACPDLATARYMRVFARLGCGSFAIPYDISIISPIADELEIAWQRTLLMIGEKSRDKSPASKKRLRTMVIKSIRNEIDEIGAGNVMPNFDRGTKQR